MDENQAEESAAEACLRDQGYLPSKPRLEYTIQPYDGGVPYRFPGNYSLKFWTPLFWDP